MLLLWFIIIVIVFYFSVCPRLLFDLFRITWRPSARKNRIHHWCSVGTGKSQPEGPPFQWTRGLGFSCRHWTSMIDSFSHIPLPNSFTSDSSLFEHESVRSTEWAKKTKFRKVKQFWYRNVAFVLRKRIPIQYLIFLFTNKGAIDLWNVESLLHKLTSQT